MKLAEVFVGTKACEPLLSKKGLLLSVEVGADCVKLGIELRLKAFCCTIDGYYYYYYGLNGADCCDH